MNFYESQKFLWWCTKVLLLTPIYYDHKRQKIRINKKLFVLYSASLIGFLFGSIKVMVDNFHNYFTFFESGSTVKMMTTLCVLIGFVVSSCIIVLNSLYQYKGQVILYNKLLQVDLDMKNKLKLEINYGQFYRQTNLVLITIIIYYFGLLQPCYLTIYFRENHGDFIFFQLFYFIYNNMHHLILLLMINLVRILGTKFRLLNKCLTKYCRPRIQMDKYEEFVNVRMEYDTVELIHILEIHSMLCSIIRSFNKGFGCAICGLYLILFLLLIKQLFELSNLITHLTLNRFIKLNSLYLYIVDDIHLAPFAIMMIMFFKMCGRTTSEAQAMTLYIQQFDDYLLNDKKVTKFVSIHS